MALKTEKPQKKRGLGMGKGIESLLGDYSMESELLNLGTGKKNASGEKITNLPLDQIKVNPNQPRKSFDQSSLNELAASIKAQGVLQPILVQKISENSYTIIAGERRYRAAKIAGLKEIPVIVRELTDAERRQVALIENIQREDLNAIEEAKAYADFIKETGISQEELAKKVGKDRSTITNSLRLLNLAPEMQNDLLAGTINAGQARALLSVVNPADRQKLYERIKLEDLSVRATEQLAAAYNQGKRAAFQGKKRSSKDIPDTPEIMEIKERLLHSLGKVVSIKGTDQRGKLVIPFDTYEELEQITELLAPDADEE